MKIKRDGKKVIIETDSEQQAKEIIKGIKKKIDEMIRI